MLIPENPSRNFVNLIFWMAEVQWIKNFNESEVLLAPRNFEKSVIYLQDMAKLMIITEMIDDPACGMVYAGVHCTLVLDKPSGKT